MPITLAQGSGGGFSLWNVVVYGVIGVIFVSTMIKNIIKENQKKARRQAGGSTSEASQGGLSLDEIAARRRAQLQEIARQRGAAGHRSAQASAGSAPRVAGGDDNANLSMAERIARARAAQQSQQPGRGPALNPASASPSNHPGAIPGAGDARQQRAAALRQRELLRQQQQREALAARQRQIQQAQAQRAAQQARPQPARPTPPPAVAPHPVSAAPHDEVHRMVTDAITPAKTSSRRHASASVEAEREISDRRNVRVRRNAPLLNFGKLTNADLRRAFVLKEVLDRPVSERDPLNSL